MKYLVIEDCATVERDTNDEAIDLLLAQLTKSVQQTCKHPEAITHFQGVEPDTGEWYKARHCESCGSDWREYL